MCRASLIIIAACLFASCGYVRDDGFADDLAPAYVMGAKQNISPLLITVELMGMIEARTSAEDERVKVDVDILDDEPGITSGDIMRRFTISEFQYEHPCLGMVAFDGMFTCERIHYAVDGKVNARLICATNGEDKIRYVDDEGLHDIYLDIDATYEGFNPYDWAKYDYVGAIIIDGIAYSPNRYRDDAREAGCL